METGALPADCNTAPLLAITVVRPATTARPQLLQPQLLTTVGCGLQTFSIRVRQLCDTAKVRVRILLYVMGSHKTRQVPFTLLLTPKQSFVAFAALCVAYDSREHAHDDKLVRLITVEQCCCSEQLYQSRYAYWKLLFVARA